MGVINIKHSAVSLKKIFVFTIKIFALSASIIIADCLDEFFTAIDFYFIRVFCVFSVLSYA